MLALAIAAGIVALLLGSLVVVLVIGGTRRRRLDADLALEPRSHRTPGTPRTPDRSRV